eukprot:TRINITY_DN551_c0_g1_i1.p1 TRINITY_DN551_c0_g1~~TRINITY_DN551_c0_g1_i1.p1  ORF type:complete len:169 (+),score=2.72 TRINITY_DN551_c0_g1_i1:447-953(+)
MSRVLDTDEAVLPSFTKLLADDAIDSKTVPDSSVVLPDFALISGSAPTLTGDTQDGGSRPTSQTSGSSEQGCPDIDTESDGDSVSDPGEIAKRAQARVRVSSQPSTTCHPSPHRRARAPGLLNPSTSPSSVVMVSAIPTSLLSVAAHLLVSLLASTSRALRTANTVLS